MYHNHHWWRFFPKKKLTQIYTSAALRSFAISLLSLFVPLYLYVERGFSLEQTIYFFIFYAVIFAVSAPVAAKFGARFGAKHAILLSVPFYLLFILGLYLLPQISIPLALISALLGLSQSFYWMGLHLIFSRASDHDHRGEELGKRDSISVLATMLGPVIGGLLIKYTGFSLVFSLTALILFGSVLFLFLSKEDKYQYHFTFRSLMDKRQWRDDLFFTARGMQIIAAGVVWPLFIFVILNDYFSLGLTGFILSGISAVLIFVVGRLSDHTSRRKIIRWVVGFESLSWVLKAFVVSVSQVFGITIFSAFTGGFMESPLGALEYDKARGNAAGYFVNREIFLCLGRILLLVFVLMMNSLSGGLILTGLASLLALLF